MAKTIKQIADEIGVSKQSIQKRITREPLCTRICPYISTIAGTKYIDIVGENMIKKAFFEKHRQPTDNQPTTTENFISGPVYTSEALFETLKKELDIKNKQIEDLNARLAETTTALVAAQETARAAQALHAGTIQRQLNADEQQIDRLGFFRRIFGGKENVKNINKGR